MSSNLFINCHIYQLSNDALITFQGNDSVSDFYTKLKSLWREVNVYGDFPPCNINGKINDREKRLKVRKLQVRSHILFMDHLPKMNEV